MLAAPAAAAASARMQESNAELVICPAPAAARVGLPPPPPPLDVQPASAHLRPLQQILALHRCHDDNPWAKYWGVCNDTLAELRACFKNEKRTKM